MSELASEVARRARPSASHLMHGGTLCRAQGEALTVDRRSLYEAFFDILLPAPLAPLLDDESEPLQTPASAAACSAPDSAMNRGTAEPQPASPPATGTKSAPHRQQACQPEDRDDPWPTSLTLTVPGTVGGNEAAEQPLGVLLTRLATQMMLDQGRGLETARLTAFVKRLAGVTLQLEPGAGMGLLAVVDRMLR